MRITQLDNLRAFIKSNPMRFIPLYEITPFAVQYGARIFDLRWGEDMCIINSIQEVNEVGQRHTGFFYDPDKSWKKEYEKTHDRKPEEQMSFNA